LTCCRNSFGRPAPARCRTRPSLGRNQASSDHGQTIGLLVRGRLRTRFAGLAPRTASKINPLRDSWCKDLPHGTVFAPENQCADNHLRELWHQSADSLYLALIFPFVALRCSTP
jgi:hypothetical protein